MGLIVQKFGGSSVKDRDRIFNVARIVMNTRNAGNDVVVVVSAQGDTTDDLITKAAEITSDPSHREMDMLLAAGEEISISLLTMALQELGVSAISLTGWQAGFRTDQSYTKARIQRLDTERIENGFISEHAEIKMSVLFGYLLLEACYERCVFFLFTKSMIYHNACCRLAIALYRMRAFII